MLKESREEVKYRIPAREYFNKEKFLFYYKLEFLKKGYKKMPRRVRRELLDFWNKGYIEIIMK